MYFARNSQNGKRAASLVSVSHKGKEKVQALHLFLSLKAAKELCKHRNESESSKHWKPEFIEFTQWFV